MRHPPLTEASKKTTTSVPLSGGHPLPPSEHPLSQGTVARVGSASPARARSGGVSDSDEERVWRALGQSAGGTNMEGRE